VLDEPTVGVDPTLRAALWDYFRDLNRSGSTIVLTTHYMDEAMHCDLVGFIQDGRMIAEGEPEEILRSTGCRSLEEAFIALSKKEA
jgi:ABC-2 type transport system ATP-binding protein